MTAALEAVESLKAEVLSAPIGRMAQLDEIADSITFLASPMSSFMSGAALIVDGGFTSS